MITDVLGNDVQANVCPVYTSEQAAGLLAMLLNRTASRQRHRKMASSRSNVS